MKTTREWCLRISVVVLCIATIAGMLIALGDISERVWNTRMQREGMHLVDKIEQFRAVNSRIPSALSEVGIPDDGPIYYNKWSDDEYVVSYSIGFGASMSYASKDKKWRPGD